MNCHFKLSWIEYVLFDQEATAQCYRRHDSHQPVFHWDICAVELLVLLAGCCWRWAVPGRRPLLQLPPHGLLLPAPPQHDVWPPALPVSPAQPSCFRPGSKNMKKIKSLVFTCLMIWRLSVRLLNKERGTVMLWSSRSPSWEWRANRPQWSYTCQVRI